MSTKPIPSSILLQQTKADEFCYKSLKIKIDEFQTHYNLSSNFILILRGDHYIERIYSSADHPDKDRLNG